MAQGDRQFVDALARGLAILECLSRSHQPIGNRAISDAVGLAPSTVSQRLHGSASHAPSSARSNCAAGPQAGRGDDSVSVPGPQPEAMRT